MTAYKVYTHEQLGPEAIKQGFSWPACFFTWIWAYIKRLWGLGTGLLIVQLILSTLAEAALFGGPESVGWSLITLVLLIGLGLYVGANGNAWRETSMVGHGFELAGSVQAESPEGAIALALRAGKGASTGFEKKSAAYQTASERANQIAQSADDDPHFETAWRELETNEKVTAVWARAFSEAEGDESKARARYVALRVTQLRNSPQPIAPEPAAKAPREPSKSLDASEPTARPADIAHRHRDVRDIYEMDFDRLRVSPATPAARHKPTVTENGNADVLDSESEVSSQSNTEATFTLATYAITALGLAVLLFAVISGRNDTRPMPDDVAVEMESGDSDTVSDNKTVSMTPAANVVGVGSERVPHIATFGASEPRPTSEPQSDIAAAGAALTNVGTTTAEPVATEASSGARETAWEKYHKPSAACLNPAAWDVYVDCVNQKMRAREAFETKWARGEIRH